MIPIFLISSQLNVRSCLQESGKNVVKQKIPLPDPSSAVDAADRIARLSSIFTTRFSGL